MAVIQLVDFTEVAAAPEKEVKKTTRRSGAKKAAAEGEATNPANKKGASRKANSKKSANENVTKAAPAARKVQAPRKSGNS